MTGRRWVRVVALSAAAVLVLGGAAACRGRLRPAPDSPGAAGTAAASPGQAPTTAYQVRQRTLELDRGTRHLTTVIWYPVPTEAARRFPVVMFSHGLHGVPADYEELAKRWAAAGFVVAAPFFPYTSRKYPGRFDATDVVNQPRDVSFTLDAVLALDTTQGDAMSGHIDTENIMAVGHSAGAVTTVGLFRKDRDERLAAGIVLAGNAVGMGSSFQGSPARLLFVHGDADKVTPYALARTTYAGVPAGWPSAFLTLPGQGHLTGYVSPADPDFAAVAATTLDFLRWCLYADPAAKARLGADAGAGNRFESRLG